MFTLFRKIKITYGITVCHEALELDQLLKLLIPYLKRNDEIIVLRDATFENAAVIEVLNRYKASIKTIDRPLNGDFSSFKNTLIAEAAGNYLFQIDADELPQRSLLKKLRFMLRIKHKYDCFNVPRINTVEGITQEHIKKWNWTVDENNYINYPDYQMRIFKLQSGIHWENKVHEVLVGFKRLKRLPAENFEYCLLHHKKIERQVQQNEFYESL